MITPKTLRLKISHRGKGTSKDLSFPVSHLICAGWVGRDREALQAHIDELFQLGIPKPTRVPIYMNLSPYLLTTDHEITVVSDRSSGEVEYVLLWRDPDIWVTVGSDHTDRDIETRSIPASKQMYAKCLASQCWPYEELKDHWEQLALRCWVTREGKRALYQQASLASILSPAELLHGLPKEGIGHQEGVMLFSGTVATQSGIVYGDSYDLELEDPVLKRSLQHSYQVSILPQYV
jgi:hypothetical protein